MVPAVCGYVDIPGGIIKPTAPLEGMPGSWADGPPGFCLRERMNEMKAQRLDLKVFPAWVEKYSDGLTQFHEFASERDLHPAQLSVAWLRKSAGVTSPVVGVSSAKQLAASIAAFDFDLTDAEYEQVTGMFDTAVKEETGGNFPNLRSTMTLVAKG